MECSTVPWILLLSLVHSAVASDILARERRDDGKVIRVTTIEDTPYVMVKDPGGSGNDNFEGFIPELVKKIAEKLDFTYELKLVADGKYATQDSNGRWEGMVGELVDNVADLAAAHLTISENRKTVVDFTEPYMSFGTVMLMKKDKDGGTPKMAELRELAKQDKMRYGAVQGGVTENFFKSSSDPDYRKMYTEMTKDPSQMVSTLRAGVDKVRSSDGDYAFIMESSSAKYWVNTEPCDLVIVGKLLNEGHYAFATRKDDELRDRINTAFQQLAESQEIERMRQKWWQKDADCSAAAAVTAHVSLAFSLALAAVASVCILNFN